MYKILIIEDNALVRDSLSEALSRQGYEVDAAGLGQQGLDKAKHKLYDVILLDLVLPDISGEEFIRSLREANPVPVIVISAKSSNTDKAFNLELGADDYITKPVSVIELVARIKAVLRRFQTSAAKETDVYQYKDVTLNTAKREVYKGEDLVKLTLKEYLILELLLSNPDQVFSKKALYERVWKQKYQDSDNSINVHIRRLRTKVEDDSENPQIIVTLWSYGYRLGHVEAAKR